MLKFAQGCGSVEEYKSEEIIQISHYYDPLKSSELHLRGLKEIMLLMLIKLAYRSIEDHIGYVELGHERSPGQGTLSQVFIARNTLKLCKNRRMLITVI